MRQQVDHHLSRARAMATATVIGSRCEVAPVLSDLQRTLARIYAVRELAIEVACPAELAFREARSGRMEVVPLWGRPESVRQEFYRRRPQ